MSDISMGIHWKQKINKIKQNKTQQKENKKETMQIILVRTKSKKKSPHQKKQK